MRYPRIIKHYLKKDFFQGRALLILGARQVGKSTLATSLIKEFKPKQVASFNGDDPDDVELLSSASLTFLKQLAADKKVIFIDEAQKVPNIGNTVKLIVDNFAKEKQVVLTGSSTLNILDRTQEPLTGRKFVYHLFPLSLEELLKKHSRLDIRRNLELYLIYGLYPKVVTTSGLEQKLRILDELTDSYLYKDIYEFQAVKNPQVLRKLLKALALQVGQLASTNELASLLGISKNTVVNYIDLLEKSFVIFRLPAYTKNKRREISRRNKIYFWDTGVRNQLAENFKPLKLRDDLGQLWENFLIAERLKHQAYHRKRTTNYFWRSYDGAEVDFIEDTPEVVNGFEIKWSKKTTRPPKKWLAYPNTTYYTVNQDNFFDFVLGKI